jgi:hypothetical protein
MNRKARPAASVANDPGCVKTLRGITAPGILGSTVTRRAKNAKICLPLGITTKSDFVFIHGVIPGWSHTQALGISSPSIAEVHLMGPCNHGEPQWSTMSDWTCR